MIEEFPVVSAIIPCYNEEKHISDCLDSIIKQTYPKEKMEIFVVDGMSTDKTKEIAKKYPVKILNNFKKIFPSANNIAIKEAQGNLIIFLGCHAKYSPDYIKNCVTSLQKNNVDCVGGRLIPLPNGNGVIAKSIALSLSGRFGKGKKEETEAKLTDTVFGGCYRRDVFDRIGLFNENLVGSSDMDFNIRLIKAGGKILYVPDIITYYYPKSNLGDFFIHNIRDGVWAIRPIKFTGRPMKLRHYLPLIFMLGLPILIWPYLVLVFYKGFRVAIQEKNVRYFFSMPLVFATRHFGYGLGSLKGVITLVV
jgi:GT2 family glycosyltransferase